MCSVYSHKVIYPYMKYKRIYTDNFLSFSRESALDVRLDTFNVVVGANNGGKSNFVRLIKFAHVFWKTLANAVGSNAYDCKWEDIIEQLGYISDLPDLFFNQILPSSHRLGFEIEMSLEEFKVFQEHLPRTQVQGESFEPFEYLMSNNHLDKLVFGIEFELFSIQVSQTKCRIEKLWVVLPDEEMVLVDRTNLVCAEVNQKHDRHTNQFRLNEQQPNIEQLDKRIAVVFGNIPFGLKNLFHLPSGVHELIEISAVRDLLPLSYEKRHVEKLNDSEGELLQKLMNLRDSRPSERRRFLEIQNILSEVLFPVPGRIEELQLLFPANADGSSYSMEICVHGKTLPISQFGSGLVQLLYLIIRIFLARSNATILLEEPEVHFHPSLQKRFIALLNRFERGAERQFFIATHSEHIINPFIASESKAVLISVAKESDTAHSVVKEIIDSEQDRLNFSALFDTLGVHASDLLQSNCVIWVEGPSDRIYILKWLRLHESLNGISLPLVEGREFSILYYGGKVLANFQFDADIRPATKKLFESVDSEFIDALGINRNAVVVMDRDGGDKDSIWNTKQRVCDETTAVGGLCWITDGTEIENYISKKVLDTAYKTAKAIDEYKVNANEHPFENMLKEPYRDAYAADKKRFAMVTTSSMETEELSENEALMVHIDTLYKFIQKAQGETLNIE